MMPERGKPVLFKVIFTKTGWLCGRRKKKNNITSTFLESTNLLQLALVRSFETLQQLNFFKYFILLVKHLYLILPFFVINCALLSQLINLPFSCNTFFCLHLTLRIYWTISFIQLVYLFQFFFNFLHIPPRIGFAACGLYFRYRYYFL